MDSNGLADPYVKLHLLPGASKVLNFLTLLAVCIKHNQCLPAHSSSQLAAPWGPWLGFPQIIAFR